MILDETIFEGLYYRYSDRLYNFAFRFVSDGRTAEDIVHEAYVTLWEKFEGKDSDTWQALLFRLVRNRSVDTLRHRSTVKVVCITESFMNICDEKLYNLDFSVSDSDKKTIYDELMADIRRIMAKLPSRCRRTRRSPPRSAFPKKPWRSTSTKRLRCSKKNWMIFPRTAAQTSMEKTTPAIYCCYFF